MSRLPHLFKFQAALEVLSKQTHPLPAVGGAVEDELRPDSDEIQDQEATREDKLLDEPFEFGQSNTYVPLQPLKRPDDHVFRYFQDGSMRSFFIGTCLEHDRQTPVILGQVGCVSLIRHDDGRLAIGPNAFRNVLMVAFSQLSSELKAQLDKAVAALGADFYLADIESKGRESQDLRAPSLEIFGGVGFSFHFFHPFFSSVGFHVTNSGQFLLLEIHGVGPCVGEDGCCCVVSILGQVLVYCFD